MIKVDDQDQLQMMPCINAKSDEMEECFIIEICYENMQTKKDDLGEVEAFFTTYGME